jgi:hypothetical protein
VTYIHNEGGEKEGGETQHPIGWLLTNLLQFNLMDAVEYFTSLL